MRIKRFFITRFRSFVGRTEIPLHSDPIVVFHGDNGSGKSMAVAALDLFFRVATFWLIRKDTNFQQPVRVQWGTDDSVLTTRISPRDWPSGPERVQPMELEVEFDDPRLRTLILRLTPAGHEVQLQLEHVQEAIEPDEVKALRNTFQSWSGSPNQAFFWLDARRRGRVPYLKPDDDSAPLSPVSASIADRLDQLATSLEPTDRERWRLFGELVKEFPTLRSFEPSVVKVAGHAELRFEQRGKIILRHAELSSGEQQGVALCAIALTSAAAIIAIEEPEISLSPSNQRILERIFKKQVDAGLAQQFIIESHSDQFDGPEVIRFERVGNAPPTVTRGPADDRLVELARRVGAAPLKVSSEGYTQLPKQMMSDLKLAPGNAHLWFLRDEASHRWQAWKSDELDAKLGLGQVSKDEDT